MNTETFKVYDLVLEELLNATLLVENNTPSGGGSIQIIDLTNAPIIPGPENPRGVVLDPPTENTTYMFINDNTGNPGDRVVGFTGNFGTNIRIAFIRIVGTRITNASTVLIFYTNTSDQNIGIDNTINIDNSGLYLITDSIIVKVENDQTLTRIGGNKDI